MSRRISLLISLLLCLTLSGCTGGQEIESCLFVIAMAVDAAPDGSLTITVKALSGTQESVSSSEQKNASGDASGRLRGRKKRFKRRRGQRAGVYRAERDRAKLPGVRWGF